MNTLTEFLALKEGLELCRGLHLTNMIVESDSYIVVDAIWNAMVLHWNFTICSSALSKEFHLLFHNST